MSTGEELGERAIITLIKQRLGHLPKLELPFGDDAVAFQVKGNPIGVLKTDMLVAKTDIPPGMTIRQAARKAVVMCISDFAAKGVKPHLALIALAIPPTLKATDINNLALGLRDATKDYNLHIVGGDTNEADDLIISPTLYGETKKNQIIPRNGAKPNDIVTVSGPFGNTNAGLKILLENYKAPPTLKQRILKAIYNPQAKLNLGLRLKQYGTTAAIDSSDGLAWSLNELATASRVGFEIHTLPITEDAATFAKLNQLDPFNLTFYGGEEYEIVATIPPDRIDEAKQALGNQLVEIGWVTRKRGMIFKSGKVRREIEARGWEHLKRSQPSTA